MNDVDLIKAAAHLATRAPEEWKAFVAAFTSYTDVRRDNCVTAQPELLQVAQGSARACIAIRTLFADCVETAHRIEEAQRLAQQRPQPRRPLAP